MIVEAVVLLAAVDEDDGRNSLEDAEAMLATLLVIGMGRNSSYNAGGCQLVVYFLC